MNDITVISKNELQFNGKIYRCSIGENGFTDDKKEGDKKTPIGRFLLRECWYRSDRIAQPKTPLTTRIIKENDGWCDAPENEYYNKHIKLPFAASHEILWREDNIYDIIVPLGFNDEQIIKGGGSAIFFHLARPDYSPTLGCIAVSLEDMLEILAKFAAKSFLITEKLKEFVQN